MHQHVEDTRSIWMRKQFAWHNHDCIMATCDHVYRVTGVDPAAPWRGTYDDEEGAMAIYEPFGGVLGLFDHGMSQAGFSRGNNTLGAVVVASVLGKEVAGINMGSMTAFVAPGRGLTECRAPVLAAWPL